MESVLDSGSRRYENKFLHLDRWVPKVRCFQSGVQAKEVWIRIMDYLCICGAKRCSKSLGITMVDL